MMTYYLIDSWPHRVFSPTQVTKQISVLTWPGLILVDLITCIMVSLHNDWRVLIPLGPLGMPFF